MSKLFTYYMHKTSCNPKIVTCKLLPKIMLVSWGLNYQTFKFKINIDINLASISARTAIT